jgi:hypothetical protein
MPGFSEIEKTTNYAFRSLLWIVEHQFKVRVSPCIFELGNDAFNSWSFAKLTVKNIPLVTVHNFELIKWELLALPDYLCGT